MKETVHVAHLALGANLGDREATLRAAVEAIGALPGTRVLAVSPFHETAPVLPGSAASAPDQPAYLNGAMTVETNLPPRSLLSELQRIEREHGRVRSKADRWAARTLDLDILLFDDLVIDEPGLTIPHPRMHERRFVLAPLADIAPDAMHPGLGKSVCDLLTSIDACD